MTANGLLAAAAAAPLVRIIRNRAMDTVFQREGDDPTWTVKTKNLDRSAHWMRRACKGEVSNCATRMRWVS